MTTELKFERPGRVTISVSMSAGSKLYVSVRQIANKRCRHLVTMYSVAPADCELVEIKGDWSLDAGEVSFQLEPSEAQQLQDTFALKVRRIPARAAS